MKMTPIITLATALMLSASTAAFAQTATTAVDTATDAATSATGGASAGGTDASGNAGTSTNATTGTSTSTDGTSTSGSSTGSINFDANADGSIDADEIASINTSLSTQTGTTVNVDANGDGVLSDDEIAAANNLIASANATTSANSDTVSCGDAGLESTIMGSDKLDMAMIAAATNVRVVLVADCNSADVTSALASDGATNLRTELDKNDAAVQAIQGRGFNMADVLGATASGDTLTVYVADESSSG